MTNHPNRSKHNEAMGYARSLGAEADVIARMREIAPTAMPYEQASEALIALYVAKWGESERAACTRLVLKDYPTIGLALNRLAYFDLDAIDLNLAAQAIMAMTYDDVRVLRQGG